MLLLVLAAPRCFAQHAATPAPATLPSTQPTVTDYSAIIADLNSDDPAARRAASLRLNSMGGDALPIVNRILDAGDAPPEAQARLRRALPYLKARFRRESRQQEVAAYIDREWNATYVQAKIDPKYDPLVKALIKQYRAGKYQTTEDRDRMVALFNEAFTAGCQNDFVTIVMGSVLGLSTHLGAQGSRLGSWSFMLAKYMAKDAPPAVQLTLAANAATSQQDFAGPAIGVLKRLLADKSAPPWLADDLIAAFLTRLPHGNQWDLSPQETVGKFIAEYRKVEPADRPGRYIVLARDAIDVAWKARGSGYAHTVTPEGWKVFKTQLEDARQCLEAAWKLDPQDPRIGALMITVCMGLEADRQTVDTWYQRAIRADPDHFDAASRMLYYLYPRWYGSHEQMIAFGRDCLATENWRGGLPFILVEAHEAVARETGNGKDYFQDPAVWSDIKRTFEGYLVNAPNDAVRRSQFARFATRAEQWADAKEQFQLLGDKADYSWFGGKQTYDYLKRKAARLAK